MPSRIAASWIAVSILAMSGCAQLKPSGLFSRFQRKSNPSQDTQLARAEQMLKQNTSTGRKWSLGGAIRDVNQALTIQPKRIAARDPISLANTPTRAPVDIYLNAARLTETQGKPAAAEAQFQTALRHYPKNLNALVGYARFLDRNQRPDAAGKAYQDALKHHPQSPVVRNDLGLFHARAGRLAEASKHLQQAVNIAPDRAMYRNNLAKVLTAEGQIEAAREQLAHVGPAEAAEFNLGVLLQQLGRHSEAEQRFQAALAANPNFGPARQALATMESGTRLAQRPADPRLESNARTTPPAGAPQQTLDAPEISIEFPAAQEGPYVGEPSPAWRQ